MKIDYKYNKTNNKYENISLFDNELSYFNNTNAFVENETVDSIISLASYVQKNCEVFIVIGIGGSYMGSKAIMDSLLPTFNKTYPEIIFIGNNLSSDYYSEVLDYIKDKEVIVNVISKSGNTLEPNIAFDCIYEFMSEKYDSLTNRIIITTGKNDGYFYKLCLEKGYQFLEIPANIGGRYSVLTPVGLLPLAVANIDIKLLLKGYNDFIDIDDCIAYAGMRNSLFRDNKFVEAFTVYNSKLYYFTEWLKQLFAESEGKQNKGILPISLVNTRDLHSLGQFLQDGNNIIFETVIKVKKERIVKTKYNKNLNEINSLAIDKVAQAHMEGGTPSNIISIESLDEYNIGQLIKFFMLSAIASAAMFGVNPFDQPGVEKYKQLINQEL